MRGILRIMGFGKSTVCSGRPHSCLRSTHKFSSLFAIDVCLQSLLSLGKRYISLKVVMMSLPRTPRNNAQMPRTPPQVRAEIIPESESLAFSKALLEACRSRKCSSRPPTSLAFWYTATSFWCIFHPKLVSSFQTPPPVWARAGLSHDGRNSVHSKHTSYS